MSADEIHNAPVEGEVATENVPGKLDLSFLQGMERHNPQHLERFSKQLEEQMQHGFFDEQSNLALLKLYQFNPACVEMEIVKGIFLKVVMHISETDMALYRSLLSSVARSDATVLQYISLSELLDSCCFLQFWEALKEFDIDYSKAVGFVDTIREYICSCILDLYRSIPVEHLVKDLNLTESEVDEFIKNKGWSRTDDNVDLNTKHELEVTSKRILESIPFKDVFRTCNQTIVH